MLINKDNSKPPIAEMKEEKTTKHSDTRIDEYFWFRNKEDSKVIEYLEAENKYTEELMKGTKEFQDNYIMNF